MMMLWSKWKPVYQGIVNRLELDSEMDSQATRLLTGLLMDINPRPLLERLEQTVRNRTVVICGAGPSLEEHIQLLKRKESFPDFVFVAADGAISLLLEQSCPSDVIVTDLDGDINHIRNATQQGALTIVHGHGDNMDRIRTIVPKLGEVLGSTQVEPTERAFLWGGFTDGDRACYVAAAYSPRDIILAGMDFGSMVGKWSKPGHEDNFQASQRKLIKLDIAQELVSTLFETVDIPYTMM